MKILLTGANGYIGSRLLPVLIQQKYFVYCCVRDINRFQIPKGVSQDKVQVIEYDFGKPDNSSKIPKDIDGAYYLIHSMTGGGKYDELEQQCAHNFVDILNKTNVKHVIYLSGMANSMTLSKHLSSRRAVESILNTGKFSTTTLRAGIIIGSGSASYEIMRDLAEKLPVMVTPKWLNTKCQPIGILAVIHILEKTLFKAETYNRNFDIGGPNILSYKEMLLTYANKRGLNRTIITLPVMTPKLSSYWLYFVTSTNYNLASALVQSMKIEVVCRNNDLNEILDYWPIPFEEAVQRTLNAVQANNIVSSWKDAMGSSLFRRNISHYIQVPTYGCFIDLRARKLKYPNYSLSRIWSIGGENGWYTADALWKLRGFIDKLFGGVGLRRGRTHPKIIKTGDALDFWRVIYASKENKRLLLFAEMKLPGEAWLEFKIENDLIIQTATFRPKGLLGRLYWYAVLPFHGWIFNGMIAHISGHSKKVPYP